MNTLPGSLRVEPPKKPAPVVATRLRQPRQFVPVATTPAEELCIQQPQAQPQPERPRLVWGPDAEATEKVPVETIRQWNLERASETQRNQASLADAFKAAKKLARKTCQCDFAVAAPKAKKAGGHTRWICGALAVRNGLCRKHYNIKCLGVQPAVRGSGRGKTRPFAGWQLPGSMTDKQHERLRELPCETPYEDCIVEMSAADPSNILKPIYEKPGSRKSKR